MRKITFLFSLCLMMLGITNAKAAIGDALDRSGWTVTASSACDESETSGQIETIKDGDVTTYWHANWGGGNSYGESGPNLPHWFIVDLGAEQEIGGIGFYPRAGRGNGTPSAFKVYVSDVPFDDESWGVTTPCMNSTQRDVVKNLTATPAITGNWSWTQDEEKKVATSAMVKGRYVMFVFTAASANYATCAEFNVYKYSSDMKPLLTETLASFKTTVAGAVVGTNPGFYAQTTVDDAILAIAAAQDVVDDAESTDDEEQGAFNALNDAIADFQMIMPSAGKYYMFVCAYPGYMEKQGVEKAIYSNGTSLYWGNLNARDITQIWKASEVEGGYNFQNYGDDKFISGNSVADAGKVVKLNSKGSQQFNVISDGVVFHTNNHGSGSGVSSSIVSYGGEANTASSWYLREVTPPAKDVYEKFAELETKAAMVSYDIWALQTNYGLVKDGATGYTCNYPSTKEGSYAGLTDNTYSSYFHSGYNAEVGSGVHYLQATLSSATDAFYFYFKKRDGNNNNRPIEITIQGSNDGENFTDIKTISYGFPTLSTDLDYASFKVECGTEYQYLRFWMNKMNTGTKYFTMSEFYILPSNTDTDLIDLKNIDNLNPLYTDVTTAQIQARIDAIEAEVGAALEVTYHFIYNGSEVYSVAGTFMPSEPELMLPTYAFVTNGTVTLVDDANVNVECTYTLPFMPSASFADAKWYILDIHSNEALYTWKYEEEENLKIQVMPYIGYAEDKMKWCFVGNPMEGFKVYNKAAGASMMLRKAENGDTRVTMSDIDDRNLFFVHSASVENSFALKLEGDNYYVNHRGQLLQGWTATDGGSAIRVREITNDIKPAQLYMLKGVDSQSYLSANVAGGAQPQRMDLTATAGAENIFFYSSYGQLLGYINGLFGNSWGMGTETNAYTVNKVAEGKYTVKYGNAYLYNKSGDQDVNRTTNGAEGDKISWDFEAVTSLPVSVSAAGYATLYAPVALTIPAGVEAYTGAVEGEKLMLTAVDGTIPAYTAVIIKAAEGTYDFAITTDVEAITGNELAGTLYTKAKPENAYTLQQQNEVVGMYPFSGENVQGFKAYLTIASGVKGFIFAVDGELTGIESIEAEGEGMKVIYDLNGRRVERAIKGVYIIDGKKVLVK